MALTKLNNQSLSAVTSAGLPSGSTLQVVSQEFNVQEYTGSSSWGDTSITATITPLSASNKILILVHTQAITTSGSDHGEFGLRRSISGGSSSDVGQPLFGANDQLGGWQTVAYNFLDSPNTTSATTYTVRYRSRTGSNYVYNGWGNGASQVITLIEIAG